MARKTDDAAHKLSPAWAIAGVVLFGTAIAAPVAVMTVADGLTRPMLEEPEPKAEGTVLAPADRVKTAPTLRDRLDDSRILPGIGIGTLTLDQPLDRHAEDLPERLRVSYHPADGEMHRLASFDLGETEVRIETDRDARKIVAVEIGAARCATVDEVSPQDASLPATTEGFSIGSHRSRVIRHFGRPLSGAPVAPIPGPMIQPVEQVYPGIRFRFCADSDLVQAIRVDRSHMPEREPPAIGPASPALVAMLPVMGTAHSVPEVFAMVRGHDMPPVERELVASAIVPQDRGNAAPTTGAHPNQPAPAPLNGRAPIAPPTDPIWAQPVHARGAVPSAQVRRAPDHPGAWTEQVQISRTLNAPGLLVGAATLGRMGTTPEIAEVATPERAHRPADMPPARTEADQRGLIHGYRPSGVPLISLAPEQPGIGGMRARAPRDLALQSDAPIAGHVAQSAPGVAQPRPAATPDSALRAGALETQLPQIEVLSHDAPRVLAEPGATLTAAPVQTASEPRPTPDPRRAAKVEVDMNLDDAARRALQRKLTLMDYDTGGVDGIFGPRTREAIAALQLQEDLEPTGFVDAPLKDLIEDRSAPAYADWRSRQAREQAKVRKAALRKTTKKRTVRLRKAVRKKQRTKSKVRVTSKAAPLVASARPAARKLPKCKRGPDGKIALNQGIDCDLTYLKEDFIELLSGG